MSVVDNKKIVMEFFDNSNKGDLESSLALMSDSLVWTGVGSSRFSGTYAGKEMVVNGLIGPLFSNLKSGIHTTIDKLIAEDDRAVVLASGKAETLDGKEYNNRYCFVFKISGEQIYEVTEFCDTALINDVFGPKSD